MKLISKTFLMLLLASGLAMTSCGDKSEADASKTKKDSTEAPAKVAVPKVEGWETYDEGGIVFQYPKDWRMEKNGSMGSKFTLYAPEDRADVGDNINLMDQSIGGMSLKEYIDLSVKGIEETNMIKDVKVLKNETGSINGREYAELSYSGEMMDIKMKWLQRVYVTGGKAYLFTFTGQLDKFDEVAQEASKIFDTFDLKN